MKTANSIKERVINFESQKNELKNELINEIKKEFETYHTNLIIFCLDEDDEMYDEEMGNMIFSINPYYRVDDFNVSATAFPVGIASIDDELYLSLSGEGLNPDEDKVRMDKSLSIGELYNLLQILQSDTTRKYNRVDCETSK